MKNQIRYLLLLLLPLLVLTNCMVPVFSDLQSARTLGKNNVELTPSYSAVSAHFEGESDAVQKHAGLQIGVGVSDKVDLRFRYERLWISGDIGEGLNIIGFGPKVGLIKDRLAFYLPLGTYFPDGEYWMVQPTMIYSQPLVPDQVDVNASGKLLLTLQEDSDPLVAFNLGLSIGPDISRFSLRPEYGILMNPGESGTYHQFSLGMAFSLIKD